MTSRILLIKCNDRVEKKLIELLSKTKPDLSIESLARIDSRRMAESRVHAVFYLYTQLSSIKVLGRDISQIKSIAPNVPITVIFDKRDFEALLFAHELGLTMVLDKELTAKNVKKALIRSELRNFEAQKSDLPLDKLTTLLTSPIEVKTNKDLYQILKKYFDSFYADIESSLICYDGTNFDHLYGVDLSTRDIYKKIKEYKVPNLFVGQVLSLEEDGELVCAFPLYSVERNYIWCLCKIDKDLKAYVLNDLFFRHLENILIYRRSQEKVSGYFELAHQDDVTGLFNQRKLHLDLEKQIELHDELEKKFSVMFIDLDHFKRVNDLFGHVVGSSFLSEIAQILRDKLRNTDKIYRYGGDEFVVIMPKTDAQMVYKIAKRIAKSVRDREFVASKSGDKHSKVHKLTISIGIAQYPCDAKTATEIIRFADSMMYASKKSGRDKVFHINQV